MTTHTLICTVCLEPILLTTDIPQPASLDLETLRERLLGKMIAQIKQAFVDEGYAPVADIWGGQVLGGQEWYGRFERELGRSLNVEDLSVSHYDNILDAARKAAGL